MSQKKLKKQPLVEVIFELQWKLQEINNVAVDPHYKILIGAIYERIKKEYPFHEPLPTASMPDEMTQYIVQHRFRKSEGNWPVIQIGPGIITVNDTSEYSTWPDYEKKITSFLDNLFSIYPGGEKNMETSKLKLRYINAIPFDYEKNDPLSFLKEKMKTTIELSNKLFRDVKVNDKPVGFNFRFSFNSDQPKGLVQIRFGSGKEKEKDLIIWETIVESSGNGNQKGIEKWLKEAHSIIEDWFFKIIEGDLQKEFE